MKIRIEGLLPAPLVGRQQRQSQVWEQSYVFESGKFYQIYSPSGRGKSTFLHILYGIRKDYEGSVFIDEQPIRSFSHKEWALLRQRRLSIVFQDLRLLTSLTAWENLQLKAALYATEPSRIAAMADHLGVKHLLSRRVASLSYGERQRIAIIRALIQPFDMLLLDEPFSHLDEANIQRVVHLIYSRCQEQNAGFILTSLGYDYQMRFDEKLLLG
ncbi:putative ABC transport system ATP-binding protein [Thermonema lapsum]|uniref:Putative ABC transport system ATP-binding protein n=1 Tax=Thermonema lapsum TaxID=28195 RepID=A0A846MPD4_9BACT|nr:ATP-binding cassette domain-containing protein [Thermonema lapsum]NIK73413.1 putative ABC transport system ATP-binding protein [Thermonema lapsum]